MTGLLDLPIEIQQKIFIQVPHELKQTCRSFVVMQNEYYMKLFIVKFGQNGLHKVKRDCRYLKDYIKSFDYWRGIIRRISERNYGLHDTNDLESKYIKDSWKLIYGIYTNRRFYVDYVDYDIINEGVMNSVNVNKTLELIPGLYNCSIGVIIKTQSALSTTSIKIRDGAGNVKLNYLPPSHLGELLPYKKFVLLDLGDFEIKKPEIKIQDANETPVETNGFASKVKISVQELDVLVKSDYVMCFIDINMYADKDCYMDSISKDLKCKNQKFWFAWWIENDEPKVSNVVNTLLKRLYRSIDGEKVEELEDIDVDTYNQNFYSKLNTSGELLRREFKFITPRDRKRYEEWKKGCKIHMLRETDNFNEPLRWKLNTVEDI